METIKIYPVRKNQRLAEIRQQACVDFNIGRFGLESMYFDLRDEEDREFTEDSLEYEVAKRQGLINPEIEGFLAVYPDRM